MSFIGRRVELPDWSSFWKGGDRYGVIVRDGPTDQGHYRVYIRLEESGKEVHFMLSDLTYA